MMIGLTSQLSHAKTEKVTYTLIDTAISKYEGNLQCELAVAMSSDRSEVRVVRLDPRKGMYSVNYFAKSTALFGNHGIKLNLDEEFNLQGRPVTTVQTSFNFKDSRHDLTIKAIIVDPATGVEEIKEKTISLAQEFFNDRPKKCLK